MRKQNSEFLTAFSSEASNDIKNTDFFGFVELDDFACYVIADGIDDQLEAVSARLAVTAATSAFLEAPSMSHSTVTRCLIAANRALLQAKSRTTLKASIIIVLTNYVKLRYGQAGNIRLRLYRDGFLKLGTTDQSLTMDMVKAEKVSQDKVADHIERNNLYTYLGQERDFHPYISKKIKLTDADAIALYTRGVWEHVDEGELQDVFADAGDNPKETVDDIEDMLLSRQPEDLQKYTLVVIFANKLFADPNKKRKVRRILILAIPLILILIVLVVVLVVIHNRRMEKRDQMQLCYTDMIEYIQINNYARAMEKCEDTLDLSQELKDKDMAVWLGNYQKLIEAVLSAQELMDAGSYEEAQSAFREAANRSEYLDRLGSDYINECLERTADYLTVYDLIYLGDLLALNTQYDRAEEKYLEARTRASGIYFDEGRASAIEALEKLYEDRQAQLEAEDQVRREQIATEESGANFIAQGDIAFAQGDYESALVYYTSAQQKFLQLGDEVQREMAAKKLEITDQKLAAREAQSVEAENYIAQAGVCADAGDYNGARRYYLLAKDIYATLKDQEKLDEVSRKLETLNIRENAQPAVQEDTQE